MKLYQCAAHVMDIFKENSEYQWYTNGINWDTFMMINGVVRPVFDVHDDIITAHLNQAISI